MFSYFYGSANPFYHRDCHVNSFQPACFSSSGSHHFFPSARSILSFLNGVCFVHPKLSLFFPPSLPLFFFKESDVLIRYPFILVKSLFSFSVKPVILMKILTELQVRHSSFFSSPVVSSQALLITSFPRLNVFPCCCTSLSFTSHYSFVPEC